MALCYFNGSVMNIGKIADFAKCEQFECKDSEITAKLIKLPSQDKVNLDNCKLTGNIEYASGEYEENYWTAEWIEKPVFSDKYLGPAAELFNGNIDFDTYMNNIRKDIYTGGEIVVDTDGIYNQLLEHHGIQGDYEYLDL